MKQKQIETDELLTSIKQRDSQIAQLIENVDENDPENPKFTVTGNELNDALLEKKYKDEIKRLQDVVQTTEEKL